LGFCSLQISLGIDARPRQLVGLSDLNPLASLQGTQLLELLKRFQWTRR
jgi:hypothetical protein